MEKIGVTPQVVRSGVNEFNNDTLKAYSDSARISASVALQQIITRIEPSRLFG